MTTDELLSKMNTLLFFNGQWHARARDSNGFGKASTPREAMERALGIDSLEDLFA